MSEEANDEQQQHPLSGDSTTTTGPLPPPPSIHTTNPAVPTLKSAPPSGNNIDGDLPPPPVFTSKTTTNVNNDSNATTSTSTGGDLPPPPVLSPMSAPTTTTAATTTVGSTIESTATSSLPIPQPPETAAAIPPAIEPPLPLPLTTFAPKSHSFLAKRQSRLPILVIATESVHQMAWKNKLRLNDLFEGLAQDLSSVSSGHPLAPFRSLSRSLLLDWDEDLKLSFFAVDDYETTTTENAQQLLQSHAALRDDDGNLAEELDLLEGQVDQLVLQAMDGNSNSSSSSSSNKSTTTTVMEANRQRQFQYEQVVKDAFALTSPPNIPWLWRFRMALDESTTHLKATGDRMSQPLVCLLVCSTSDYVNADLDACIQDLAHPHNLPKRFYGGTSPPWDSTKLKREVVVLHDAVEGPQQSVDLESLENQLKMNYGPNASLLTINSIVPSMAAALEQEETSDLWHGGGTRGNALSVSDRLNIRRYLAQLVASSLLPQMERRIAELNAFVTEKKKGVRNVFRGIFGGVVGSSSTSSSTNKTGGKAMDGTTGASTSSSSNATSTGSSKEAQFPTYRFDSIEAQARLLADSLFLMKDYEAAFSIYKLIKDDYKSERAMLQYASVQEHMALCLFHMMNDREASYYNANTTTKEMFGYLETALFHYTRVAEEHKSGSSSSSRPTTAPDATRLATRLCLVLSSAFITDNSNNIGNNNNNITSSEAAANAASTIERHLEVADLLASASSHETSLGAAVLLEQSSAHYYRAKMYRKYAFHMLMSGHMFRSAQQEHHAFRCFTSALYIYQDGQQWNELHNHLRSALAAQLYSLGRMAISVELYAKLVGTTGGGKVSVKSQQKFLNHLQEICQSHSKKALVGADRMATPLLQKRQERLQHIVSIIRSTKTTVRVLEIPNMDLPQIHDESISVEVDLSEPMSTSNHALMSKWKDGAPDVWEKLECLTLAEVRASNQETTLETTTSNSRVANNNTHTHRCLAALDQEESNRRFATRSKKLSSYKGDRPIVRAQREPLQVSVTVKNPLSVTIELHHVQLVARLKKKQGASTQMCTNEHAIRKKTQPKDDNAASEEEEEDLKKEWTFSGSSQTFVTPDFMLHSSSTGADNKDDSATTWSSKDKNDNEEDPYFVVTCHKQILTSRNKTTLQMYICPLVEGELEILGLRAKLFNKVWMYHPFCLQGPLLQNTQHNRATRARAPSVRLQSLVQKRMPRLQATWEYSSAEERSNQASFFIGEVTHWTLRLTNRGTAPLHDKVSLKTNLPWIHVLQQSIEEGDDVDPESMGTSTCIGPSGTLLSLALPNQVLEPGQSVDIPLAIRCDMIQQQQQPQKSRKQDLYFLFRYGYEDEFRWLRQMCTISMAPSLSLSASVMPSYWQRAEHVLSVEITNQNPQTSLQLEKMALVSRDYRLEPIAGQQQPDDDNDQTNEAESSLLLQAYERATMHYRLIPTTLSKKKKKKCMLTECLFSLDHSASVRRQECTSSGSTMDFICLERAHSNFTQALIEHQQHLMGSEEDQQPRHVSQIRRDAAAANDGDTSTSQEDADNKDHPTSISQLFPHHNNDNSIDLICTWNKPGSETNANTATSSGQHVLPHISVRPPNTGCPLTLTSRHPSRVVHDFSSSPIVMVPLEITIRNRLHPSDDNSNNNNALEFEFSLEHDPSGIISFQGSEQYASNSLGGGDDITLSLQAYIQQPGVVNLQMVRLTILEKQQEQKSIIKRTPYLFPLQWMVKVVDESVEDLN